jgi:endonuclease/exonuclease/phosphatase family metal-dependent hydrolase
MPTIRVASLNGEWMNNWFTSDALPADFVPTFDLDTDLGNDTDVTATRLANLIRAVDPDILGLEEAPSRREELALFVDRYLSDGGIRRYELLMGDTGGAQKLALLYKPTVVEAGLVPATELTNLIQPWDADVDGDGVIDSYEFTRTPLVTTADVDGRTLRVIVAHTKSNFINHGEKMWNDPSFHQAFIMAALKNRRRISTEAMRIRTYLDEELVRDPNVRIIVMGDLNDGPGRDYFEEKYLAHNVTDILVGSPFDPELIFTHAQHDVRKDDRYTAVFDDFIPVPTPDRKLLLDHVLLSPSLGRSRGLRKVAGSGAIHHKEYDKLVVNKGQRREDRPTDHRPVSVQLEY